MTFRYTLLSMSLVTSLAAAQIVRYQPDMNQQLLKNAWPAQWIACPGASSTGYGVYHFRRTFNLREKPRTFVVHVSADNRYRLFVNEKPVCAGPARGTLDDWRFETVDIGRYLQQGNNLIAAQVWNLGEYRPLAQMSLRTAFILQADSDANDDVNTDSRWKAVQNSAYQPIHDFSYLNTYYAAGACDSVDASRYPWGWQNIGYDDSRWAGAQTYDKGKPKGLGIISGPQLAPRTIPFMEESLQRIVKVRRSDGIDITDNFLKGNAPLTIPANHHARILFDQTVLTVAYPEISASGGKGARIKMVYSEAMYDGTHRKGNRNEITDKEIAGYYDVFLPDGQQNRVFRPLWFRTYRYLQLDIETKEDPLTLNDLYGIFTAYPLKENATFQTDNPELRNIWDVGWRTARLCAHETYFDCPYYEQLQYVGDTRIQALISLYVSGDDQLVRNAIKTLYESRIPEGLTLSRYPCFEPQVIPPFSLFWITMIHDYHMLREDREFVNSLLFGISGVLDWYEKRLDRRKAVLGPLEYWPFVDWAKEWPWISDKGIGGVPTVGLNGESSIMSLQLAYTLNQASHLFEDFGDPGRARHYRQLAGTINRSVVQLMWDDTRQMVSDTPEKKEFSQHANALAILSGAISGDKGKALMERVSRDESIIQCTIYFRFYLLQAMKRAGLADRYTEMLEPWKEMLRNGLTTFAEQPEPTRSDCHAWSSSPNYDFLATICGIEPAGTGFKSVRIEPHLGQLTYVRASMPHPRGEIKVDLRRDGSSISGKVTLPKSLTGEFLWRGKKTSLHGGENAIP